jgi:hypothetical protein
LPRVINPLSSTDSDEVMGMSIQRIGLAAAGIAVIGTAIPTPATAIVALPTILVGPPTTIIAPSACKPIVSRTGGGGPGAAIPFRSLALGAPVERTASSFITGGGGTSNAALAAQRKAAGLPYKPPTVDPQSGALPATFAVERGASMTAAPYQRLPLASSNRVAEPYGLIFAQATSPTRGRIVALTLSITGRPAATPRLRITNAGSPERGCQPRTLQVYAPAMSAAAVARLFTPAANGCHWFNLTPCTRAQWPRGRVLFVSPLYDNAYEYRWIDYDMLADWQFGRSARR